MEGLFDPWLWAMGLMICGVYSLICLCGVALLRGEISASDVKAKKELRGWAWLGAAFLNFGFGVGAGCTVLTRNDPADPATRFFALFTLGVGFVLTLPCFYSAYKAFSK